MKNLFFLRHGKAESYFESDINRKLTSEGIQQVENLSTNFIQKYPEIELIISSSAQRAKQTAEIFSKKISYKNDILFEHFIYEGYSTSEFIDYLKDLPQLFNNILIVGHNPNISTVVSNLSNSKDVSMAPAELYGLSFNIEFWNQLEIRSGELIYN